MTIFSGARSLFEKYSVDPLLKKTKLLRVIQVHEALCLKLIKESDRHSVHLVLLSQQRFLVSPYNPNQLFVTLIESNLF